MDYEIFHDESKEHGYWHGILLVPATNKSWIIEYLKQIRKFTKYEAPISIKKIKSEGKIFNCAKAWLDFAIGCMITQLKPNDPYQIFTGERVNGKKQRILFDGLFNKNPIGLKFILSRDKEHFKKMYNSLDYGGKVETSFRIAFKGGVNYLFSENDFIRIIKFHFDNYKHHGRNINPERIVNRISGLNKQCQIKEHCPIDDRSSDHQKEISQIYDDCQLLQLTDLLIGSFRTALGFLGQGENPEQKMLAEPVKKLVERYKQGYARMKNSRWRDSFCISESYIENDKWQFQNIEYAKKKKQKTFWD